MPITINSPILSTDIFIALFLFILLASLRRKKNQALFPPELTRELKGLAILAIVFSHIGYFLSTDHGFLFPLSIMAGVGVNLFLFLSGYGLTMSSLKEKLPPAKFYKKRLLRLFAPFWLVIISLFLLDFYLLGIAYGWPYVIRSLAGFFPRADLFLDINSPLWFFTPILFYYLIFPLIFSKKRPWLTAILIYTASYFALRLKLPITDDVLRLYQLHLLAFPLGAAFASLFFEPYCFSGLTPARIKSFLYNLESPAWLKMILDKLKTPNIFRRGLRLLNRTAYYFILIALLFLIGYTAYYSGVGDSPGKEQAISLLTMGAIILFFMMKKFEIKIFCLFGVYAYEIYLIHWPLVSRYDLFFKLFPGWLALTLYLGLFLILAYFLRKFLDQAGRIKTPR